MTVYYEHCNVEIYNHINQEYIFFVLSLYTIL